MLPQACTVRIMKACAPPRQITRGRRCGGHARVPSRRAFEPSDPVILTNFWSYNAYQGGIAFEDAGDPKRAQMQLARFIEATDKPSSPAAKSMVDDARARLAKLSGDIRR